MPKYLQIYERYWASALHTFRGLCIGACRGNSYINSEKGMLAEGKTKPKKKNKPERATCQRTTVLQGSTVCKALRLTDGLIKLATCKHAALSRDSDAGSDHYLSPRCPTKHLQGTARPRNKQNTKDNGADEYSEGSQRYYLIHL